MRTATRTSRLAVGAVALLLLGTACGGGQQGSSRASTTAQHRGLDGVDAHAGAVRLLHVYIASPGDRGSTHLGGDDAELFLTLANDGTAPDALTRASTDAAAEIRFRDGDGDPTAQLAVEVPPGGVAPLRDPAGPHLELAGLTDTLRSGFSFDITFTFRDAGAVTVSVPVATYDGVRSAAPSSSG